MKRSIERKDPTCRHIDVDGRRPDPVRPTEDKNRPDPMRSAGHCWICLYIHVDIYHQCVLQTDTAELAYIYMLIYHQCQNTVRSHGHRVWSNSSCCFRQEDAMLSVLEGMEEQLRHLNSLQKRRSYVYNIFIAICLLCLGQAQIMKKKTITLPNQTMNYI